MWPTDTLVSPSTRRSRLSFPAVLHSAQCNRKHSRTRHRHSHRSYCFTGENLPSRSLADPLSFANIGSWTCARARKKPSHGPENKPSGLSGKPASSICSSVKVTTPLVEPPRLRAGTCGLMSFRKCNFKNHSVRLLFFYFEAPFFPERLWPQLWGTKPERRFSVRDGHLRKVKWPSSSGFRKERKEERRYFCCSNFSTSIYLRFCKGHVNCSLDYLLLSVLGGEMIRVDIKMTSKKVKNKYLF